MEKGKPGLAILIGHALAKKGKAKHDPAPEYDEDSPEEYKSEEEAHAHLKEIMSDFLQAVKDEDVDAMADLFHEAFECSEMTLHKEGPHVGEEDDGEDEGNSY